MRTRTQSSAPLALKACAAFVMAALPTLALSQSFEYKRFHPGLNVAPPPAAVQEPPTTPTLPTLEAALQLSTSRVIFEDTPIGGSLLKQVALTNTGTAPLTFTAVPAVQGAGFSPSTTTCGSSLAVLADCLVEVRFAPSGSGAFSGKLVLSTPLASSPHEVALQGNGFNPLSLASASLTAGTAGSAYSANFASYLTVTGLTGYTPSNTVWSVVAGSLPTGLTLTSAGQLQGTPSQAGTYSFDIRAAYNGATATRSYTLTLAEAPVALVQLSTTAVNFSDTATLATATRRVTVSNTGNATLSFSAAPSVQGTGFALGGTSCSTSLAATSNCWVDVTFAPTAVGAASGKLTVSSTLPSSPHEVALQGNGFNPVNLATGTLAGAVTGTVYNKDFSSYFSVTGDASPTLSDVSWSVVSGALPSGMTLSAAGVLSGAPTAIGNYSFGVRATYRGNSVTTTYALAVTAPTDSDWASVTTLLNFEGTAGTTTLTEPTKGLTLTFAGSAQLSAQKKFGNTSLSVVSGSVTMPGSRFAVGTRPFTLEAFVRRNTASSGSFSVLDTRPSSTNGPYITLTVGATGDIAYYASTANRVYAPAGTIPNDGAWYHLAYSRDATGTGRLFVNGVQVGSNYADGLNYSAAANVAIGKNSFGTAQVGGYIDAMRLTDGVGRYATNFTPPSADYPTQ